MVPPNADHIVFSIKLNILRILSVGMIRSGEERRGEERRREERKEKKHSE